MDWSIWGTGLWAISSRLMRVLQGFSVGLWGSVEHRCAISERIMDAGGQIMVDYGNSKKAIYTVLQTLWGPYVLVMCGFERLSDSLKVIQRQFMDACDGAWVVSDKFMRELWMVYGRFLPGQ